MIRPFAPMAKSDIVIASPLSLRLLVGAAGDKNRDFDFLSSRIRSLAASPALTDKRETRTNLACTQCHSVSGHWALDAVVIRALCVSRQ